MKELIHFTASWCQPCKAMAPMIAQFVIDNPDIAYTKVDVDESSELMKKYEVSGVPTFIINMDGEQKARHTGLANPQKFLSLFE
jgi:thioredoxin 1